MRLQEERIKTSVDYSIFIWASAGPRSSLLAESPSNFSNNIVPWGKPDSSRMTNKGLRITLPIIGRLISDHWEISAVLYCRYRDDLRGSLALRLRRLPGNNDLHVFGEPADDERLRYVGHTMVTAAEIATAERQAIETSRAVKPVHPELKYWIRFVDDCSPLPITVLDIYPQPDSHSHCNPDTGFFSFPLTSRVRIVFMIGLRSGRSVVVHFGCNIQSTPRSLLPEI